MIIELGEKFQNKQLDVQELTGEEIADLLELVDSIDFKEVQKSWKNIIKNNKHLPFKALSLIFKEDETLFKKLPGSKLCEIIDAVWVANQAVTKNLSSILTSQITGFVMGFVQEMNKSRNASQLQTSGNA